MIPRNRHRRLVALLLHQPGLSLLYGDRPPPTRVLLNLVAVGVTIAAMLAAWHLSERPLIATIATWAAGHMLWGAWLATR